LLQFVATMIRPICSTFHFVAARRSLFGRTFNPKAADARRHLLLRAAAADDLRESLRHIRIETSLC
jgi:hypothetical protein